MEQPGENEKLCRRLIVDYKRVTGFEKKSYVAESELEQKLGNHDRSMEILEQTIRALPNAPQSVLRLSDMQSEKGRFEDVIRTMNYAFVAYSETQLSINGAYMVFLKCLVEDAILHQKQMKNEPVTQAQIDHMRAQYEKTEQVFPMAAIHHKRSVGGLWKKLDISSNSLCFVLY